MLPKLKNINLVSGSSQPSGTSYNSLKRLNLPIIIILYIYKIFKKIILNHNLPSLSFGSNSSIFLVGKKLLSIRNQLLPGKVILSE